MPQPEPENADLARRAADGRRPATSAGGSSRCSNGSRSPCGVWPATPDKLRPLVGDATQVVRGDVLDPPSLDEALHGVHTAYYLVHLMSGSKDFEKDDRQAATNFAEAAKKAGVRRIIYLGGLGDDADPNLSPHLRSRHEVGEILRESGVETVEFRAVDGRSGRAACRSS